MSPNLSDTNMETEKWLSTSEQKDETEYKAFEIKSTSRGIRNQILMAGSILVLTAGCGMPIGYSAVLLPQLYNTSDELQMDVQMGSWFASVHSLATPIGSFFSGSAADRFGRRTTLIMSTIPILIGWVTLALAQSHILLMIGRVVAGIGVGLVGAPAQILIAEVTIPRLRGILIGSPFVSYSMGILLVYSLGSRLHWRLVAWLGTVLPIFGIIALLLTSESPTWLVRRGAIKRATKSLTWLRGDESLAKQEINELVRRSQMEKADSNPKEICTISTLKSLIIINGFNFLQILSGTFLIVFYAVDIISQVGADFDTMTAAVMTAIVRLVCTMIFCILLLTIQRRSLVLISGLGSGLSAIVLGFYLLFKDEKETTIVDSWVSGACIFLYISFNTGFMILPGIMVGELLPAKIRGIFGGYIFAAFNIVLFGLTKIFPYLQVTLKTSGLFVMFGVASFVAMIFMYLFLPETKYMTLGQIEDYFEKSSWLWVSKKNSFKTLKA